MKSKDFVLIQSANMIEMEILTSSKACGCVMPVIYILTKRLVRYRCPNDFMGITSAMLIQHGLGNCIRFIDKPIKNVQTITNIIICNI